MREPLRLGDRRLAPVPQLAHAVGLLRDFAPPDEEQAATLAAILAFARDHPDALHRSCQAGHLTGSALVTEPGGRVLLVHHRKLGRWLQPGGHCDGDANLPAVALREAVEESGIPDLAVDPRILDVDIHPIAARGAEPLHLHLDVRFRVVAPAAATTVVSAESIDVRWFTVAEARALGVDTSLNRLLSRVG